MKDGQNNSHKIFYPTFAPKAVRRFHFVNPTNHPEGGNPRFAARHGARRDGGRPLRGVTQGFATQIRLAVMMA